LLLVPPPPGPLLLLVSPPPGPLLVLVLVLSSDVVEAATWLAKLLSDTDAPPETPIPPMPLGTMVPGPVTRSHAPETRKLKGPAEYFAYIGTLNILVLSGLP
jgi:hypothetical protein